MKNNLLNKIVLFNILLTCPAISFAQSPLLQAGPWSQGHVPQYIGQGSGSPAMLDSGPASGGVFGVGITELNLTIQGLGLPPFVNSGTGPFNTNFCDYDGPITGPNHFLCLSPNAQGGGLLVYGAQGGAAPLPFQIDVNGVLQPLAVLPLAATNQLYGGTGIAGTAQPINLGTNLSITGNTLNAATTSGVTSVGIASPNATLTPSGTNPVTSSGTINLDINLAKANTWTGTQTFPNGSITNSELANPSTTVNGQTCTLGSTCTVSSSLAVGSTPITGGSGNLLSDTAGVLSETAANTITSGATNALKSATTTINVNSATAPTAGQVLTATGPSAATWQNPSGPSGLNLISTQTASVSASLSWTGLGTAFNNYLLNCADIVLSSGTASAGVQFGIGATPTFETSGYAWSGLTVNTVPTLTARGEANTQSFFMDFGLQNLNSAGFGLSFSITIYNILMTNSVNLAMSGTGYYSPLTFALFMAGEATASSTPKTAIRLIPTTGTITTGICSLYGISN
jgi:hypothetical protein